MALHGCISEGCQSRFPPALDRGQTSAQPERLRPSVTGSNLGVGSLGSTQVDFQAGELVSPAHNYIYTFECHVIIYVKWFMTHSGGNLESVNGLNGSGMACFC